MGISLDTSSKSGVQIGTTGFSWSHTVGVGSNAYLVVGIVTSGNPTSNTFAATYGGVAMTPIGKYSDDAGASGVILFGLAGPATGSNTVAVTVSPAIDCEATATSWFGVNQTTSYRTVWSVKGGSLGQTSISNVVSDAVTGDVVVDVVSNYNQAVTKGASQTLLESITGVDAAQGGTSYQAATGSTTMLWTAPGNTFWADIATALIPAPVEGHFQLESGTGNISTETAGDFELETGP